MKKKDTSMDEFFAWLGQEIKLPEPKSRISNSVRAICFDCGEFLRDEPNGCKNCDNNYWDNQEPKFACIVCGKILNCKENEECPECIEWKLNQ